jgi:hypothetical protein
MRTRLFLVMTAVAFCAAHAFAAARTFVSADNGLDTNPCTRALPCRSFSAALVLTDPDGEVVAIDSGGYGTLTITQPASLISPRGVHAAIAAQSTDGIVVNASSAANVLLRNLALTYQGPIAPIDAAGIRATTVGALYVEGCSITGYPTGLLFSPTTSGSRLYVTDSVFRRGYGFVDYGIHIASPYLNAKAVIDSTQIYDATNAVYLQNAQATIRDCIASNGSYGYEADYTSQMVITSSVAKDFSSGFFANNASTMIVSRCLVNNNRNDGLDAGNDSNLYVSGSSVVENYQAAFAGATGAIRTRGNNTVQRNSHSNGVFTISYSAH